MLSLHDRTSVEVVVAALHARSLRYVIGVTDAQRLASDPGVLRAFATTRPYHLRRALGVGRKAPHTAEPVRIAAFAAWAAPLTGLEVDGGVPTSLVTLVEKARKPDVDPLCLHLVTGEPVGTRLEVAAVVDAYLTRPVRPDLLDPLAGRHEYAPT